MSTPVDPNAPVREVGETDANWTARWRDYLYKTGGLTDGAHAAMAKSWTDPIVNTIPAPSGFTVK
jgi:hypothetical protein